MQKQIDSDDDLPLEKTLTWHNFVILIKSVFNKNQNHYYYNIFLGKCLYQLAKKIISAKFFGGVRMLKFGKTKVAKKHFMVQEKQ